MVIPRENVGHQGAQHIEWRLMANAFLQTHIGGNLIHGHVAGPFDHDLDILIPGPLCQSSQLDEFRNLSGIGAVIQAAGTEGVSQADGHIKLPQDVQNIIKVLIEWVFLARHLHPGKEKGAPPRDNVHLPLVSLKGFHGPTVQTGVDGHKVHPFLGVGPHHLQEILRGNVQQILLQISDGIVHRNGTNHRRRQLDELLPEGVGFPVVGQIHNGLRPKAQRHTDFVHLHFIVVGVP